MGKDVEMWKSNSTYRLAEVLNGTASAEVTPHLFSIYFHLGPTFLLALRLGWRHSGCLGEFLERGFIAPEFPAVVEEAF